MQASIAISLATTENVQGNQCNDLDSGDDEEEGRSPPAAQHYQPLSSSSFD
jgi:hypothetical protein